MYLQRECDILKYLIELCLLSIKIFVGHGPFKSFSYQHNSVWFFVVFFHKDKIKMQHNKYNWVYRNICPAHWIIKNTL